MPTRMTAIKIMAQQPKPPPDSSVVVSVSVMAGGFLVMVGTGESG